VPTPGVKVGGVWLCVLGLGHAVRVEDEFVGGEVHITVGALDAFGPGAVVARRDEISPAAPSTFVHHVERKVVWQFGWSILTKERFAQSLCLPFGDHTAAAGGDGHGARPPEDLQLDRGALHAGDAQSHSAVVDLIVAVVL